MMELSFANPFIILAAFSISSFLNVCISRIPHHARNLLKPSACPVCGVRIKWYDNIPVLSYLFLKGKCRACGAKISWRYPLVEIVGTALILLTLWRYGFTAAGLLTAAMICLLLVIAFIDFDHRIVPNELVVFALLLAIANILLAGHSWSNALAGFFVGGLFLLSAGLLGQVLFKKDSMGAGDIKLAAMLGAFMGLRGILISLLISVMIGALFGIVAIISGKIKQKAIIPFAPFIALGTSCYLLFPSFFNSIFHTLYGI